MEVLNTIWSNGTIGIVKAKNEAGEINIYIGVGIGNDEAEDIQRIIDWGTKFTQDEFKNFVK